MNRRSGFSLIELLLVIGVLSFISIMGVKQFVTLTETSEALSIDADRIEIRDLLRKKVNCDRTLAAIKAANAGGYPSPGTSVANFLMKKDGSLALGAAGQAGGVFAGSREIFDSWFGRAVWTGLGISIALAKSNPAKTAIMKDPVSKSPLNFSVPANQLFNAASAPLCAIPSNAGYTIDTQVTTSSVIAALTGESYDTKTSVWYETPLRPAQVCHLYCSQQGYVSGYATGFGDSYYQNINGVTMLIEYAAGESVVVCRCIK